VSPILGESKDPLQQKQNHPPSQNTKATEDTMKIKIKKITDPDTAVPVNSENHRIEQIKQEIIDCKAGLKPYKVPVVDMWEEMDNNCSEE